MLNAIGAQFAERYVECRGKAREVSQKVIPSLRIPLQLKPCSRGAEQHRASDVDAFPWESRRGGKQVKKVSSYLGILDPVSKQLGVLDLDVDAVLP